MPPCITIKQLHATTGELVRRAGASRSPVLITDRGEPVAVLASTAFVKAARRRKRTLLPEFKDLMRRAAGNDTGEDLDAVRGDR